MAVQLPKNGIIEFDKPYQDRDSAIIIKKKIDEAETPIEFVHYLNRIPLKHEIITSTKPVMLAVENAESERSLLCFTEKDLELVVRFE